MMMVTIIKASARMTKTLNPVSVVNPNLNATTKTEKVDLIAAITVSTKTVAVPVVKIEKVIGTAMHAEVKRTLLGALNATVVKRRKVPKETLMEVSTEVAAVDRIVKEIGIVTDVETRKTFLGVLSAIVVMNPNQPVQVVVPMAVVAVSTKAQENPLEAMIVVAEIHLVESPEAAAAVVVSIEVAAIEALAAMTAGHNKIKRLLSINLMPLRSR